MVNAGFTPIVPHLSTLWQTVQPHSWEWWLAYDLRILRGCSLLVRIPGESKGADVEVRAAIDIGIPAIILGSSEPAYVVQAVSDFLESARTYHVCHS